MATLSSQCRGPGFHPWSGRNWISHTATKKKIIIIDLGMPQPKDPAWCNQDPAQSNKYFLKTNKQTKKAKMPRVLMVICQEGWQEGRAMAVSVPPQPPQHATMSEAGIFPAFAPKPQSTPLRLPMCLSCPASPWLGGNHPVPAIHLSRHPCFRKKWLVPVANPCLA